MFNDAFAVFQSGKAAHIIGLMSDIGHWKDFSEFLDAEKLGVMLAPVVTSGATPSLPYDGGIGYAVAKWTKDPKVAADLVRSLTSTDALKAFYADAGAITADTTIDVSQSGPAVTTIVGALKTGKPAPARGALLEDARPDGQALPAAARAVRSSVDEVVKQMAAVGHGGLIRADR